MMLLNIAYLFLNEMKYINFPVFWVIIKIVLCVEIAESPYLFNFNKFPKNGIHLTLEIKVFAITYIKN